MFKNVEQSALFSILCTCIGTGILQLPLTLKQGGWTCLLLILLVAILTNTTGRWLIKCLYSPRGLTTSAPPRRLADYPAVGLEACGVCGKLTVQVFHKATLLGVTSIFMVLTAKFLLEGIGGGGEGFVPSLGTPADAPLWQKRWAVVAGVIVWFPVVFIKSMKEVEPLALFGMLASLLCVLEIVVFALILQPVTSTTAHDFQLPVPPTWLNQTNIKNGGSVEHSVFTLAQFPVAFSAITLSFGGHAVFPDIEKSMKNSQAFDATFNLAYAILLVVYVLAAVFGFYTFGDITYSPILCNFPRSTSTVMGAVTASTKLLIAFHVMSAYPILMTVLTTEIESSLGWRSNGANDSAGNASDDQEHGLLPTAEEPQYEQGQVSLLRHNPPHSSTGAKNGVEDSSWSLFFKRTLLRTVLVVLTCCIAIFIPFFGLLMELVGAMCLTMMVFVLPVVFSWSLWGDQMSMAQKVYGIFIVSVGAIGGMIGTVQALQDIAHSLQAGKHE
jgi:amino acid permease